MQTSGLRLAPVLPEEQETLRELLEKYLYEFSQYTGEDVGPDGRFGYPWLAAYGSDPTRNAFFVRKEGALAGFVLLNRHSELGRPIDHAVAEFCILPKYRRQGVGTWTVSQVFARFPGLWEIKYHPGNTASQLFWQKAAAEHASGGAEALLGPPNTAYPDGSPACFLVFRTNARTNRPVP